MVRQEESGAEGSRTLDLLNAIQALSQLSYGPTRRDGNWREGGRIASDPRDVNASAGSRRAQRAPRDDRQQHEREDADHDRARRDDRELVRVYVISPRRMTTTASRITVAFLGFRARRRSRDTTRPGDYRAYRFADATC